MGGRRVLADRGAGGRISYKYKQLKSWNLKGGEAEDLGGTVRRCVSDLWDQRIICRRWSVGGGAQIDFVIMIMIMVVVMVMVMAL